MLKNPYKNYHWIRIQELEDSSLTLDICPTNAEFWKTANHAPNSVGYQKSQIISVTDAPYDDCVKQMFPRVQVFTPQIQNSLNDEAVMVFISAIRKLRIL
jgi:hypothetical protein